MGNRRFPGRWVKDGRKITAALSTTLENGYDSLGRPPCEAPHGAPGFRPPCSPAPGPFAG
jgi:hypothetical protein